MESFVRQHLSNGQLRGAAGGHGARQDRKQRYDGKPDEIAGGGEAVFGGDAKQGAGDQVGHQFADGEGEQRLMRIHFAYTILIYNICTIH